MRILTTCLCLPAPGGAAANEVSAGMLWGFYSTNKAGLRRVDRRNLLASSQRHVGKFELIAPHRSLIHLAPVQRRDLVEMP